MLHVDHFGIQRIKCYISRLLGILLVDPSLFFETKYIGILVPHHSQRSQQKSHRDRLFIFIPRCSCNDTFIQKKVDVFEVSELLRSWFLSSINPEIPTHRGVRTITAIRE